MIYQLQALLQQNQELLSQTLESSEHFREEENAYRDQLANLRRAKEKLEEKIMDQYKNYERSSKKLVDVALNGVVECGFHISAAASLESIRLNDLRDMVSG